MFQLMTEKLFRSLARLDVLSDSRCASICNASALACLFTSKSNLIFVSMLYYIVVLLLIMFCLQPGVVVATRAFSRRRPDSAPVLRRWPTSSSISLLSPDQILEHVDKSRG